MPYRKEALETNYFYHFFNRGVEKRDIYLEDKDYIRFLSLIKYYRILGPKIRFSLFNPQAHLVGDSNIVEVVAYCLMPNHFHFILKQTQENGISRFISDLCNRYTSYFNVKYNRVGPLFQGNFKAILVDSEEYLLHLSRYIHLNPHSAYMINDPKLYQWSSIAEYLGSSNESLCRKEEVLSNFSVTNTYLNFVDDYRNYALNLESINHLLLEN